MGKYHRFHRVDKSEGKLGDVIGKDCRHPGRRRAIAQSKPVYPIQNEQFCSNGYDPRKGTLICKPIQNEAEENVYGKMRCSLFFSGQGGAEADVQNVLGGQAKKIETCAKIIHVSDSFLSCGVREPAP